MSADVSFVGPNEAPPAHPEAVFIGRPLDGARNPKAVMGAVLSDITGVVTYQVCLMAVRVQKTSRLNLSHHCQFGSYYVLPLTAPEIVEYPDFDVPPSTLNATVHPCQILIGDYNVCRS